MPEQDFKNHRRIVPTYHIAGLLSLLAYLGWSAYQVWLGASGSTIMTLLLSIVLLLMFISLRSQILRVQDRLIRLEMRLRLRELLPADVASRAADLPIKQLVALRFASDAELPNLTRDVLAGKIVEPRAIKLQVKEWQADHLRA
jgi:Family of unknown function (DUF6526)